MTINETDNCSYNEKQDDFHCCCQNFPDDHKESKPTEFKEVSETEVLSEGGPQTDEIEEYYWVNCENYEPYENYKDGSIKFLTENEYTVHTGFIAKSVKETKKDENMIEFLTFQLDKKNKFIDSSEIKLEDLLKTKEAKEALRDVDMYYDAEIANNYPQPKEGEKNEVTHKVGDLTATVRNFVYTKCPPNWSPYDKRTEGYPLLQITENADIRFSEHFSVVADDSGITITVPPEENDGAAAKKKKKKKEKIKFTYKQLKKLLEIANREIKKEEKANYHGSKQN